ncbi:ComEC/Rec2 family competence protein [Jiella sp. MQZ9-1]|nr:ComEC/Rec2 family competence protein [Jiella flava]
MRDVDTEPPFGEEGDGCLAAARRWLARQVAIETAHRSGFHVIPVALIAGMIAIFALDWRPNLAATFIAAALFVAAAVSAASRPVLKAALVALAGLLVGALVSLIDLQRTDTTIISGTVTTRIAGTVLAASRDEKGHMRYLIAIAGTARPALSRPPQRAQIVVVAHHMPKQPGDPYDGLVRLSPPSGPVAPGAHDFAFQPFFDGVGALGFALGAPDARPAHGLARPPPLQGFERLRIGLEQIRDAMTARIAATAGGEAGAVAAALVTGNRAGISDETETWLRGIGLAHVLSISGLHLAIVAGSVLLLLRCGFALIPGLALRYPVKKIAAGAALIVAALYLLLSGGNVATQRAFVMLAVMLVAVMADRQALTLRNVSLSAIIVVLIAPHQVTTASFQMSFAATLALVAGYGDVMRWRPRDTLQVERPHAIRLLGLVGAALLGIAASSIMAGVATAPLAAYHFHRIAPFGLVANILILPLFTLIIMPLGLLGTLLMPFGLDAWCFHLMGLAIELALAIAAWLYALMPDHGTGPIAGIGVALLAGALLSFAYFASHLRWAAAPLAILGLLTIRDTSPLPQLLVYEDGRTIAAFEPSGAIAYLAAGRPRFVADQWARDFGSGPAPGDPAASPSRSLRRIQPPCDDKICRFTTRDGLRVVWTSDYKRTGEACDGGDIAIVARAIRLTHCRSGAILVTLRTLRETGSLAFSRDPATGKAVEIRSVAPSIQPWNRHRLAPWPHGRGRPKASKLRRPFRRTDRAADRTIDSAAERAANQAAGRAAGQAVAPTDDADQ